MKHTDLPTKFTCSIERTGDRAVVRPAGELDLGTAATVDVHLREAVAGGAKEVVLDLRKVTFLGSTGLRLVLTWDAGARASGFGFAIVRGPRPVQRVFELTRIADRLRFVDG